MPDFRKLLTKKPSNVGFTLIELLISVSLLAIAMGIASDLIITLVRTYTKTQAFNDIEQTVNFVFLKLQNDIKSSNSASVDESGSLILSRNGETITYSVDSESVSLLRNAIPLLGVSSDLGDVHVRCAGDCFSILSNDPTTVKVSLEFYQGSGNGLFDHSVSLQDAFVVRGTY